MKTELRIGSRRRPVARARQIVAYLSPRKLGLFGAAVARTMNVSLQATAKAASKGAEALNEIGRSEEELLRMKC